MDSNPDFQEEIGELLKDETKKVNEQIGNIKLLSALIIIQFHNDQKGIPILFPLLDAKNARQLIGKASRHIGVNIILLFALNNTEEIFFKFRTKRKMQFNVQGNLNNEKRFYVILPFCYVSSMLPHWITENKE
ncbi:UNVERIFIED_CONTAM: hypothetical protein RMT77_001024 [Armadillidium vulgare]